VIVGSVKKSIAAMASGDFEEGEPAFGWSGSLGVRFIQREIVRSEISKPSRRSSPWKRGAPRLDSRPPFEINSRTALGVNCRPMGFLTLEIIFTIQPEARSDATGPPFPGDDDKGLLPTRPDSSSYTQKKLAERAKIGRRQPPPASPSPGGNTIGL